MFDTHSHFRARFKTQEVLMTKTITSDNTVLLESLLAQRTRMLSSYLELLDIRLQQAKELGIEDTLDLRTIHLNLGRRSGSSTWVREMLTKYEDSLVICTSMMKDKFYTDKAISIKTLPNLPPSTFTNKLIFFDVPLSLERQSEMLKYIDICSTCRAFIIV